MEALSHRANAVPQNRMRMAEPMPVITPETASIAGTLSGAGASSRSVPAHMSSEPVTSVFFEM